MNRFSKRNLTEETQEEVPLIIDQAIAINKLPFWSLFAACISCLGGFLFGYDLGVVGILIAPSFQSHFGIDPNDKLKEADINGTIVSVLQIGCLFGALLATSTADAIGRKFTIACASFVSVVGGVFQIIGYDLGMMYAGRIISGLGVGALSALVPLYVSEIAHQNHRGLLGGLWMFFIATGLASSYWANYIVRLLIEDDDDLLWRIPLIIQIIPAIVLFLGMIFLFETPRWLCTHHQADKAYQVLCKLRGTTNVKEEMDQIRLSVETEAKQTASTTWKHVFSIHNRKRLLLGCSLQALQQMTGTNVINYFSPIVFRSIGLSSSEAELFATGMYGIVKMIVVLIGFSFLIDRFGRRPLLIGGGIALAICLCSVSVCVTLTPVEKSESLSTTAILGILFMY
ncbi:hypothetical protein CU098_004874, partial [Rhizopus stolonifer]